MNTSRGAISFADIRTINNVTYPTFKNACYVSGLLDDDRGYIDGILEASQWGTTTFLRSLFVTLLLSNQISRPEIVWNNTWQYLSADIVNRQRVLLRYECII